MKQVGTILQRVLLVLVLVAVGLGVYNVSSDLTPVFKAARLALRCESESACQISRYDRRPWEQRLEIFVSGRGKVVRCHPKFVLVGDLECTVTEEPVSAPQIIR